MKLKDFIRGLKHGGFRSFLMKAHEKGAKIKIIQHERPVIVQLTYKKKTLFCTSSNVPLFRRLGNLTTNKSETKTILEAIGIRTPRGVLTETFSTCLQLVRKKGLSFPLIAKPVDGSLAKGVTWNVQNIKELKIAFSHAKDAYGKRKGSKVLVEEMFLGNEYRILVFNGRVLSAVHKIPAGVIGDGISTISQLIHSFNKNRVKGFEIKLDKVARASLKKCHLNLKSVLPAGKFFPFRNNLNMSDGGRAVEVTNEMDSELKKICVRAVEAAGLTFGGLDLIAKDIRSIGKGYVVLEINPKPFYNMHEKPLVEGKGVDVSLILLNHIF